MKFDNVEISIRWGVSFFFFFRDRKIEGFDVSIAEIEWISLENDAKF